MPGRRPTIGDSLVAVAVVVPVALVAGAALGYYGDRFGISGGMRGLVIAVLAGVSGYIGRKIVTRRMRGRAATAPQ